jgi:hypothetical protein
MKESWRDAAGNGVFGEAGNEGVDLRGRAEFTRAEKIGVELGVEGLLLVEASFTVGVENTEVLVILGARHAARAAVCKRELTTRRQRRFAFHGMTLIVLVGMERTKFRLVARLAKELIKVKYYLVVIEENR